MLSYLDKTIENLLRKKVPLPEADYDISFDIPTKEWVNKISSTKPTINIYLYDVRENRELRTNEWETKLNDDGTVTKERPPVRLNVFYLITAWSPAQTEAVLDEHHLLSQILAVLFKFASIPEDVLEGDLAAIDPPPKLPLTVACPDAFKEQGVGQFWNAVDQYWRPFIHLIVTIPIDLQEKITGPAVRTKIIKLNAEESIQIGGRVVEASDLTQGIANVMVTIVEFGKTAVTDNHGYFTFSGLNRGTYTFKASINGREATRIIQVPASDGNYDLVLS